MGTFGRPCFATSKHRLSEKRSFSTVSLAGGTKFRGRLDFHGPRELAFVLGDKVELVGQLGGKRVLFLKPQTFMNLSGEAVRDAASFYKIPPERVIVLSDDVSLDVGTLRVRPKGSAGGQNGLKNIIYHLGSEDFPRVKIGVGKKPRPDYDLAAWVLGRFPEEDQKAIDKACEDAVSAAACIIESGCAAAAQNFNGKRI